jgi:sigma-B regulation protein RsbU (phosphoserine phosphatase)
MAADACLPTGERFLIESAARLNQVLERQRIYEAVRDLVTHATQAEACSLLLLNGALKRWEFQIAYNRLVQPDEVPPLVQGQGLAGWVAEHEASAVVPEAAADPRLRHLVDRQLGFEVRSVMAVPLLRASRVFGVIEALNSRRPEGFTGADLELLEALANQIAVALANARLYELVRREKRANELLYRVGLALSRTLRLEELLPLVTQLLRELIDFDAVGIYLYDPETRMLEWFHGHGYHEGSEEQVRLKIGQGAVGWVAEHREALIIPDVHADPRYLNARPGTRSEMGVPLVAESELVGVFNIESDAPNAFNERDLRLLSAFGNQTAIAIQRARLHDQAIEKRRMEEEIRIARRIQRRLLPSADPVFAGLDIAAFNHPSLEVSGDVYDFLEITSDQLGILVGDVSGKGIPAGILMATFQASMRAEIRNNYAISVILNKVNRLMHESIEETAFVTAVYGVFDRARRRLTYSNAGHNPPVLLRASGAVEWLREGGTVLGVWPDAEYTEAFVDLGPGDLLVFYTDGISEAVSPTGEMFGAEHLLETLRACPPDESARGVCRRILEAVHRHCGHTHMDDDLTAVVLRPTASGAQDQPAGG